jgi:hypothetical protein
MPSPRSVAAIAILLFLGTLAVPTAPADQGQIFTVFAFDTLKFEFHPEGVEKSASSDPEGSAIRIFVVNVAVVEWDAYDLRHCIDGHEDCEYPIIWQANNDGQVQAEEVEAFQKVANSVAKSIEEVGNLTRLVQENITVDGVNSASPQVTSLRFENAAGPIDSMDRIDAYVDVTARYDNDADADSHTIQVRGLDLAGDGFEYGEAIWTVQPGDGWAYDPSATEPPSAASKVSADGWVSDQASFETATASSSGLSLAVVRAQGEDGGGSPSNGLLIVLAGVGVAIVVAGAVALGRRQR